MEFEKRRDTGTIFPSTITLPLPGSTPATLFRKSSGPIRTRFVHKLDRSKCLFYTDGAASALRPAGPSFWGPNPTPALGPNPTPALPRAAWNSMVPSGSLVSRPATEPCSVPWWRHSSRGPGPWTVSATSSLPRIPGTANEISDRAAKKAARDEDVTEFTNKLILGI